MRIPTDKIKVLWNRISENKEYGAYYQGYNETYKSGDGSQSNPFVIE